MGIPVIAAMSATETVLSIPELLEQILLNLDMQDLLTSAQRVNKHWQHIISTSPRLQQTLFFRPIASPAKPSRQYTTFPSTPLCTARRRDLSPYRAQVRATLNPLLAKRFGPEFFNTSSDPCRCASEWVYLDSGMQAPWSVKVGSNLLRQDETGPRERAFRHPNASWRRMLVSQPPQPGLGYVRDVRDHESPTSVAKGYIDASHEGGLRFGLLYDLVQTLAVSRWKKHHTPFRVSWGAVGSAEPSFPVLKACMEVLEETGVVLAVHYEPPKNSYYPESPQPGTLGKEDFGIPGVEMVDVVGKEMDWGQVIVD
ncbi:hypothetical protein BDW68DRAFT_53281 [Aspergillus falconensis]